MAYLTKHAGMRPQDVVILLDIVSRGETPWLQQEVAKRLKISASETGASLTRSAIAGLYLKPSRQVNRQALYEFIVYGLRYVFPAVPGPAVRGIATAFSAPVLQEQIVSAEKQVWPWATGQQRGHSIEPLFPTVPPVALLHPALYDLLALVDALRIGRAREQEIARKELAKRLHLTI